MAVPDQLKRLKARKDEDTTRLVELTLAISIILSNLSHNKDFIASFLGVDMWYERSIENESNETNTDSAKPKLGSNQETQKKVEPVKSTPTGNEALTGLYVD
jgi:hypothetical protein